MWSRADLKRRGKRAIFRNFWACMLVALVLSFTGGTNSGDTSSSVDFEIDDGTFTVQGIGIEDGSFVTDAGGVGELVSGIAFGVFFIAVAVVLIALLLLANIFLFNPLTVGGYRFYLENTVEKPRFSRIGFAFRSGHYGSIAGTMFFRDLYVFLWSLLLVIPGIVKSYEYRMVPYLLADAPDMSRSDAFQISRELMDGQKWNAFVLDLSFIGWKILAAFTLGILDLVFVDPYQQATNAELFVELKRQYFAENTL